MPLVSIVPSASLMAGKSIISLTFGSPWTVEAKESAINPRKNFAAWCEIRDDVMFGEPRSCYTIFCFERGGTSNFFGVEADLKLRFDSGQANGGHPDRKRTLENGMFFSIFLAGIGEFR
jgi:hypothetical protein